MPTVATAAPRAIAYGGGVQSTAMLVLAKRRVIDFPLFMFCNVGADSEHPATLKYVHEVAMPYAEEHGIELLELHRERRDGRRETLWQRLMRPVVCKTCRGTGVLPVDPEATIGPAWPEGVAAGLYDGQTRTCPWCEGSGDVDSRSLPIPVRMSNGAPGTRSCTADFKIKIMARELKRRGATGGKPCRAHKNEQLEAAGIPAGTPLSQVDKDFLPAFHPEPGCTKCTEPNVATIGIGISLDEILRANNRKQEPHERVVYPLIGIGEDTGLKLRRDDCMRLIADEGLPVPPKSSCFFCPFHRPTAWQELAHDTPELFERSVLLEDTLNERRTQLGKDPVYLTRFGVPLREAIDTDQQRLPLVMDDGACDSGYCFT